MTPRARLARVSAATALLAAACMAAARIDPLPAGLTGSYFTSLAWSGAMSRRGVEYPSTAALEAAWAGAPPASFSAAWTGTFVVLRDDTYTFATASDDGAAVDVDGREVVSGAGRHDAETSQGAVHLAAGEHSLLIRYVHDGGHCRFSLSMKGSGGDLAPIAGWRLAPHRVPLARLLVSVFLRRSAPVFEWIASSAGAMALIVFFLPAGARMWRMLAANPVHAAFAAILLGSLALNAIGIWWGLPGYGWAGDELTLPSVLDAIDQHFSHGWFDRWPPLHFYVLTLAYLPEIVLERFGRGMSGQHQYLAFLILGRLISLAMAVGSLAAVYLAGRRAFSERAGLFAALALALLLPFVYYAKTANLDGPLTFWFALSLLFYVRALQTLTLGDHVLFAAFATCAVCTKDQAAALYFAAPFVLVYAHASTNRRNGVAAPWRRALLDRRLAAGLAVAVALFAACHNLLFNFGGFLHHVRYITGAGSEGYRLFERSALGHLQLLLVSVKLDGRSWGWPLFAMSAAGFGLAIADRHARRISLALAALVASYYVGFINPILYNYDRFLLPVCVVQALFAGLACDRLLADRSRRRGAGALLTAVFGYSLLYAATVDALMIGDSRYAVEGWLREHVGRGPLVDTTFPQQYLPRLDGVQWADVRTIADLRESRAGFYLLNADYGRAEPETTPLGRLIAGLRNGTLGYALAFRYRAPSPWPWLPAGPPDLVGPRTELPVFSFLRNVNPEMEVYRRLPSSDPR